MGEMAAVVERGSEDRVAGRKRGEIHAHVGLRARMRLDVGILRAEQLFDALDGQRFGDVHELASAVVAPAGVAFGVLVGHHGAGGFAHRRADVVLRRDQLEIAALAFFLFEDGLIDLGVGGG